MGLIKQLSLRQILHGNNRKEILSNNYWKNEKSDKFRRAHTYGYFQHHLVSPNNLCSSSFILQWDAEQDKNY